MATEQHIARRAVLKGAPAALVAALTAGDVNAACTIAMAETPIMALFREWQAAWDASMVYDLTDAEREVHVDEQLRIEELIVALPALNAADFVAKVTTASSYGGFGLPYFLDEPEFWAEARAVLGVAA